MKKMIRIAMLALLPFAGAWGAGGNVHLEHANIDPTDQASLQRGAKYFVNYCLSCHSAGYARYNRVGQDLGLTDDQVSDNLIFTTDESGERTKVGSLMFVNMTDEYGAQAFGARPPNLTLVARSRGVDWLYTYLKTFYLDDSRPLGVNNLTFPNVGMPHAVVTDLVNFLHYLGEPAKQTRLTMGKWVIGFLVILLILAILLKKEYWRDVH